MVFLLPPTGQLQYELLPKPTVKFNHYSLQEKKKSSFLWGTFFRRKSCWLWRALLAQAVGVSRGSFCADRGSQQRVVSGQKGSAPPENSSGTQIIHLMQTYSVRSLGDWAQQSVFWQILGDSKAHLILRSTGDSWSRPQTSSHLYACMCGPSVPSSGHSSFFSAWQTPIQVFKTAPKNTFSYLWPSPDVTFFT